MSGREYSETARDVDSLHFEAGNVRHYAIRLSHSSETIVGTAYRTLRETTHWLEYAAKVAREKLDAGHE